MSQVATSERISRVEASVKSILLELSGFNLDELDKSVTFLELGFDSLFLIQFSQALKKKLNLKVSFRQLIEEIGNFAGLINYVDQKADDTVLSKTPVSAPSAANQPRLANSTPPMPTPVVEAPVARMAPTDAATPVVSAGDQAPAYSVANPTNLSGLEAIMAHQLQIMAHQLDMLRGYRGAPVPAPTRRKHQLWSRQ